MSISYFVLGQSNPAAATTTTLYTSPSAITGGTTIASTLVICNQSNAAATYRVAVKPTADTLSKLHYVAYNASVAAYDSIALTLGITMGTAENIIVYSSSGSISFNLFGTEII